MKVARRFLKEKNFESLPVGYTHQQAFFIDFVERYAIDGALLGKHIRFHYGNLFLSIVIPSVVKNCGSYNLGIPHLFEAFGCDLDCWGTINNYQSIEKPETIRAWLASVVVIIYSKDATTPMTSTIVQQLSRKVLFALQVINPDAIRKPSDELANDYCAIKSAVSFKENERPQIELSIKSVIDNGFGALTINDIHTALEYVEKSVSAPYAMLCYARRNLSNNDTRASVLNCATSIEVMLKKKISKYLDSGDISVETRENVLKQADGYSKLVKLCKQLKITLPSMPNVQETVMRIRHKVIHGGYVPTYKEAQKAYSDTRTSLGILNVPKFE